MDSKVERYNQVIDILRVTIPKALPLYAKMRLPTCEDIYYYGNEGPVGWKICDDRTLRIENSYVGVTVYLTQDGRLVLVRGEADIKYNKNGRDYEVLSVDRVFKGYLELDYVEEISTYDLGLIELVQKSVEKKLSDAKQETGPKETAPRNITHKTQQKNSDPSSEILTKMSGIFDEFIMGIPGGLAYVAIYFFVELIAIIASTFFLVAVTFMLQFFGIVEPNDDTLILFIKISTIITVAVTFYLGTIDSEKRWS